MFSLVLIQMMILHRSSSSPVLMVSKLGLLNTTAGLVFPGIVTAFGTYLLKQDMRPPHGSGGSRRSRRLQHRAEIPQDHDAPDPVFYGLLGIFTALFAFKDLMWPMIVCTNSATTTLSAGLAKMQGQYGVIIRP